MVLVHLNNQNVIVVVHRMIHTLNFDVDLHDESYAGTISSRNNYGVLVVVFALAMENGVNHTELISLFITMCGILHGLLEYGTG